MKRWAGSFTAAVIGVVMTLGAALSPAGSVLAAGETISVVSASVGHGGQLDYEGNGWTVDTSLTEVIAEASSGTVVKQRTVTHTPLVESYFYKVVDLSGIDPGDYRITLTGEQTGASASATFTIRPPAANITVSAPASVRQGGSFVVSGTGWAGDTGVRVNGSFERANDGSFSATVSLNATRTGSFEVVVSGDDTGTQRRVTVDIIAADPTVVVTPSTVPQGGRPTISGGDWPDRNVVVTVTAAGSSTVLYSNSEFPWPVGADGTFSQQPSALGNAATFPPGDYTVSVKGAPSGGTSSGLERTATFTVVRFTSAPTLTLSPKTVGTGGSLSFTAGGLLPGEQVKVYVRVQPDGSWPGGPPQWSDAANGYVDARYSRDIWPPSGSGNPWIVGPDGQIAGEVGFLPGDLNVNGGSFVLVVDHANGRLSDSFRVVSGGTPSPTPGVPSPGSSVPSTGSSVPAAGSSVPSTGSSVPAAGSSVPASTPTTATDGALPRTGAASGILVMIAGALMAVGVAAIIVGRRSAPRRA